MVGVLWLPIFERCARDRFFKDAMKVWLDALSVLSSSIGVTLIAKIYQTVQCVISSDGIDSLAPIGFIRSRGWQTMIERPLRIYFDHTMTGIDIFPQLIYLSSIGRVIFLCKVTSPSWCQGFIKASCIRASAIVLKRLPTESRTVQ